MSRIVIDRVVNADEFNLHFEAFVRTYNASNNTELKPAIAGLRGCSAYLQDALLPRYDRLPLVNLILVYRDVTADIAFMMYSLIDEIFPPATQGNYTEHRLIVLMDYITAIMREASNDPIQSPAALPRELKISLGWRFKTDPKQVLSFISTLDLNIDEYRGARNLGMNQR